MGAATAYKYGDQVIFTIERGPRKGQKAQGRVTSIIDATESDPELCINYKTVAGNDAATFKRSSAVELAPVVGGAA